MEGYSDHELIEMGKEAQARQAEVSARELFRRAQMTEEQRLEDDKRNLKIASMTLAERSKMIREGVNESLEKLSAVEELKNKSKEEWIEKQERKIVKAFFETMNIMFAEHLNPKK